MAVEGGGGGGGGAPGGGAPTRTGASVMLLVIASALLCPLVASSAEDDAGILHRMRQAVWAADPGWTADLPGWRKLDEEELDVCKWYGVMCNIQQRVTRIELDTLSALGKPIPVPAAMTPNSSMPLLPELARLEWLERLSLTRTSGAPAPLLPPGWLEPGAFPRLDWLTLAASPRAAQTMELPNILPGALPQLEMLELIFPSVVSTLPSSWGDPATLPRLLDLRIVMQLEGGLPNKWASGFLQLARLHLSGSNTSTEPRITASNTRQLPPDWPAGFPKLEALQLVNLGLAGPLPPSWQEEGFPHLVELALSLNNLSGTLPAQFLKRHPSLTTLELDSNTFSGTLPGAWGSAEHIEFINLSKNMLSGAAFPRAWLQPGAMPSLMSLYVDGNPAIEGTLPADLSWPKLQNLDLTGTGVAGIVPDSWCYAPFSQTLQNMELSQGPLNASLPECAASAFAKLQYPAGQGLRERAQFFSGNKQSGRQPAACNWAGAAVVLPLVLLLAGSVAGRALLRRRLRVQHPSAGQPETELLCSTAPGNKSLEPGQGLDPASSIDSAEFAVLAKSRLRRLNSLLSATLHARHGLIHIDTLPTGLPHQLGSQDETGADSPAPSCQRPPCLAYDPHAAEQVAWLSDDSLASDSVPAPSRKWRLGTMSLQLSPGELEFVVDASGNFVLLGLGGFAACYLGKLHDAPVAVKVYEMQPCMDSLVVWHEVAMLRSCVHERILPLYAVAVKGQLLLMVMALMPKGTLKQALESPQHRKRLCWQAQGLQVALDVAEGLDFLHREMRVLHGDLKPTNVLLDNDWRSCIGDLGMAQFVGVNARTMAGCTHSHAAPEQLLGVRCTVAADMYSFGTLLVELITQKLVFTRGSYRLPRVPEECSEAVLTLIKGCLSMDPARRPTAAQALECLRAELPEGSTSAVPP